MCVFLSLSLYVLLQEQVSESTTTLVLKNLTPNTMYTVTVVPVYAEGDGPQLTDKGKTSKCAVSTKNLLESKIGFILHYFNQAVILSNDM